MGELTDKIKGNVNEMVGKAKQAMAGDADDPQRTHADDKLAAEGKTQELKGKGEQLIGKVKGALGDDI
ncbi:MAG: CsbD family protein [Sphingomonadales bacterium]|nr:MAG: CsbD family protein [Sphingomonadales bacterium]